MKKLLIAILALASSSVFAGGGGNVHLDHADVDISDQASLQRGANYFVNYCLNCHSMKYERWQRMQEFGIPEDLLKQHLMPSNAKPGDLMTTAMKTEDAANWFGAPPPDLTLESRLRGDDWIYTYLRSFYIDESRPFGVNNIVFDKVGMPHVLWELQGMQKAVFEEHTDESGHESHIFKGFEMVKPGKLTAEQYDQMALDLTNFLSYMGDPSKLKRHALGIKVLLFLLIFFIFAYLLKKEYWKDVH
ncbi:MAG: cytochrome c1 [Pseudomonadota bacterium]